MKTCSEILYSLTFFLWSWSWIGRWLPRLWDTGPTSFSYTAVTREKHRVEENRWMAKRKSEIRNTRGDKFSHFRTHIQAVRKECLTPLYPLLGNKQHRVTLGAECWQVTAKSKTIRQENEIKCSMKTRKRWARAWVVFSGRWLKRRLTVGETTPDLDPTTSLATSIAAETHTYFHT